MEEYTAEIAPFRDAWRVTYFRNGHAVGHDYTWWRWSARFMARRGLVRQARIGDPEIIQLKGKNKV